MTLVAMGMVLALWCAAGTVVGLLMCKVVRWAQSLEVTPDAAPALPAPRPSDEQLEVPARERSSAELVER